MPELYNGFSITQGSTWDQTIYYSLGDPPSRVNLSGYSGSMNFTTDYGENLSWSLTPFNSGLTFGTGLGEINLFMSAGDTSTVCPGQYVYSLFLTSPALTTEEILMGRVTVNPGVF
jgi:hypothetical protein